MIPQWRWVMDRAGKWHAMLRPEPPFGTLHEPMKGGHQFIKCRWTKKGQRLSIQIWDYSPTNPLPSKCCQLCRELIIRDAVLEKLGATES